MNADVIRITEQLQEELDRESESELGKLDALEGGVNYVVLT